MFSVRFNLTQRTLWYGGLEDLIFISFLCVWFVVDFYFSVVMVALLLVISVLNTMFRMCIMPCMLTLIGITLLSRVWPSKLSDISYSCSFLVWLALIVNIYVYGVSCVDFSRIRVKKKESMLKNLWSIRYLYCICFFVLFCWSCNLVQCLIILQKLVM